MTDRPTQTQTQTRPLTPLFVLRVSLDAPCVAGWYVWVVGVRCIQCVVAEESRSPVLPPRPPSATRPLTPQLPALAGETMQPLDMDKAKQKDHLSSDQVGRAPPRRWTDRQTDRQTDRVDRHAFVGRPAFCPVRQVVGAHEEPGASGGAAAAAAAAGGASGADGSSDDVAMGFACDNEFVVRGAPVVPLQEVGGGGEEDAGGDKEEKERSPSNDQNMVGTD